MFIRTITPVIAAEVLMSLVTECDSLELERVIDAMASALRFARARSQRNTEIDQRMYAARHDGFCDMTEDPV